MISCSVTWCACSCDVVYDLSIKSAISRLAQPAFQSAIVGLVVGTSHLIICVTCAGFCGQHVGTLLCKAASQHNMCAGFILCVFSEGASGGGGVVGLGCLLGVIRPPCCAWLTSWHYASCSVNIHGAAPQGVATIVCRVDISLMHDRRSTPLQAPSASMEACR
jgi:hypothetical protein